MSVAELSFMCGFLSGALSMVVLLLLRAIPEEGDDEREIVDAHHRNSHG
jgi:hypothetical protein